MTSEKCKPETNPRKNVFWDKTRPEKQRIEEERIQVREPKILFDQALFVVFFLEST